MPQLLPGAHRRLHQTSSSAQRQEVPRLRRDRPHVETLPEEGASGASHRGRFREGTRGFRTRRVLRLNGRIHDGQEDLAADAARMDDWRRPHTRTQPLQGSGGHEYDHYYHYDCDGQGEPLWLPSSRVKTLRPHRSVRFKTSSPCAYDYTTSFIIDVIQHFIGERSEDGDIIDANPCG